MKRGMPSAFLFLSLCRGRVCAEALVRGSQVLFIAAGSARNPAKLKAA